MKPFLILFVLVSSIGVHGQKKVSSITLAKGVILKGMTEKFNATKHKKDTCKDEFSNSYVCRIDGKIWYGNDRGLELPRNQFTMLSLSLKGKIIPLDISGMFNPQYGYEIQTSRFAWKKKENEYLLYGFFSDGAGTYTAHWKIIGGKSSRVLISNDEKDFKWQTIK